MRWRRSSWRSPIYTGWPLPAVSLLGGGVHFVLAARVPERGEKRGEERQQVGRGLLILQGGPGARGAAVEAVVGRGHGASSFPVATGKGDDKWGPSVRILFFSLFFRISSRVLHLIEASNHFLKFCKNSSGFQMTCRVYPKIGVAIKNVLQHICS